MSTLSSMFVDVDVDVDVDVETFTQTKLSNALAVQLSRTQHDKKFATMYTPKSTKNCGLQNPDCNCRSIVMVDSHLH